MEKIRLQKYFTDMGIMSRRACEKEILDGNIKVNGLTASPGDKVLPGTDIVTFKGKTVEYTQKAYRYLMLNKPMGYVTTMTDEQGRKTAAELVSDCGTRVYPVGRLDMYSEGLLIFTNDGDVANRVTHPSGNTSKVYSVKIKGILTDEETEQLKEPMVLDGYELRPVDVGLVHRGRDREGNDHTVLRITLYEGRNRQIRRMCEKCGFKVMRLRRIEQCGISLSDLPLGKWRDLTEAEVRLLKGEQES